MNAAVTLYTPRQCSFLLLSLQIDDDIVFIKDGSFEHLVYQTLFNKDYTFFSGSVVNNPHGFGIHQFAGAVPQTMFHWRDQPVHAHPPFVNASHIPRLYYGKTIYDDAGSVAHEAFVYNVAMGRLDTYTFDLWNLNQCQCGQVRRVHVVASESCEIIGETRFNRRRCRNWSSSIVLHFFTVRHARPSLKLCLLYVLLN